MQARETQVPLENPDDTGSSNSSNEDTTTEEMPTSPSLRGQARSQSRDEVEHLLLDPGAQRFPALTEDYNDLPTYPLRPSYKEYHFQLRPASRPVVFDGCPEDPHKPASVPIYQTATFQQPSSSEFGSYDYTRSGNPTRTALEKQVAMLEFAHAAFAFTTGMSALNCVTRLLKPGDCILLTEDIYGGMHRLVSRVTAMANVNVVFIPTWDLDAVEKAFHEHPNIRILHMETPSNPLMRITDIRAVADICHANGCLLTVDSTMMSPHLQQPLNHGADIVIHSMTKFFGGHSDTMGGVVAVATEELAKQISFFQNAEGTGLGPFDCWLFLRGIKTLAIRVERAQENAHAIAAFLKRQSVVKKLYYAGLEPRQDTMKLNEQAAKDFKIHMGQARGGGSVISFTTGSTTLSRCIVDSLHLYKLTVSFGSCNSLVEMPAYLSHASIPAEERTLPEDLIRLSIGIEDVNDLIDDLQKALLIATGKKLNEEPPLRKGLNLEAKKLMKNMTKPEAPSVHSHIKFKATPSRSMKKKKVKKLDVTEDLISLNIDKNHFKLAIAFITGVACSVAILSMKK
eukprot:CAMPEP_0204830252 /NCGR_PEP_ID=MMETSP1346-20131115/8421_1 /ASSEMBLY_ACC=CAM_ASM_000771 /TAXON_ID=215587 /ORGANISM="Aplanochytrium stocchinoi, Strain GSBS06" /LENGTH=568 /DNA_ID=CAMNT_0051960411 /DNA_START=219 /DNA_END=1925 /DNA_ORIENTATION=+